jgi:sporadic carbohydrate cluster 2OG-Fe(II) oxygenase
VPPSYNRNVMNSTFEDPSETALCQSFLKDGHVVLPAENPDALDAIQSRAAELAADHLGVTGGGPAKDFLDEIGDHVDVNALNALRLAVIQGLNAELWLRPSYFSLARSALETIVGNELAMQLRINLSIQLPNDNSSLLPIHADVWSGDSPFEVVLWVPLVDCYATKSMFLMPMQADRDVQARLSDFQGASSEDLYHAVADEVAFLDVPYGKALLFSQNQMHGNRINREPQSRWSMNCRFKSVFSPYKDKKLGEFFEPITLRPATRIALDYQIPGGFNAS